MSKDSVPPPDHDDFIELRDAGLRAARKSLEKRKKGPTEGPTDADSIGKAK